MADLFDQMPELEPSAATGFAGNRIERRSEHRSTDASEAALRETGARLYLFRADKVLMRGTEPLFTLSEADAFGAVTGEAILLGWTEEGPRLIATIDESAAVDEARITLTDLRALALGAILSPEHLGALAQGRSLINWHARHRFCSNCGAASAMTNGGTRRDCPACGAQHFPRTDPVVIMLAVDRSADRVLLGRQPQFLPGVYSALAGFVEPGETLEDAVRRETLEEAGIRIGRVRYHASQPWPFPTSMMIGCHAEALSTEVVRDESELEDCRWFTRAEIVAMLNGTHPGGLTTPKSYAIAHALVAAWARA